MLKSVLFFCCFSNPGSGVPVISTDEVKQHEEEKEEVSDDEPEEFWRKCDEEFEPFFQVEYAAKQKIILEQKNRESL